MTDTGQVTVLMYDATRRQWMLLRKPLHVLVATCLEDVPQVLVEAELETVRRGRHAAGFVAYEAAPALDPALDAGTCTSFPLAWFGVFAEMQPVSLPPPSDRISTGMPWQPSITREDYGRAIAAIQKYLAAGDTYQVNFSFRLRSPFDAKPWPLFLRMAEAQGPGYGAFIDTPQWAICSASPELFFRLDGEELLSKPMKGTAPRGLGNADDNRRAEELKTSEKNRAENVMIVDMVRNDMGRVGDAGTVEVVRLFDVERYPTVWQMTSSVRCLTRAGLVELFRALFPAASITGAPKVRTMQIIRELESSPRRIYTGAIGFLSPGRTAQFNVAIRTVLVDRQKKTAEYGLGGGIVWDSGTEDEWDECATKALVLETPLPNFSLLETIGWTPGEGFSFLDPHLRRLTHSAAYFGRAVDIAGIRRRLEDCARRLPAMPHRIRLLVPASGDPAVEARALEAVPQPYRVRVAREALRSGDVFLYHKTTQRNVYDQARAGREDCEDVLLWNERGELTESCIANVVVEIDGRRVTPPLNCGLLPGIYRAMQLESGQASEEVIRVSDLPRCSHIFLCNSVRGLWEVVLATS